MRLPRARAAALALAIASLWAAASCARCSHAPAASAAEELLPKVDQGALATSSLGDLADHLAGLSAAAAQLPEGDQLMRVRSAFTAQLGFDPLTREGLASAGLDPSRAAAATLLPPDSRGKPCWIAALPVAKEDLFRASFERLAQERAGLSERSEEKHDGNTVVRLSRPEGATVAYALTRGFALVARGDDAAARVAAQLASAPANSLAKDGRFSAARARLGAADLTLLVPKGSVPSARIARGLGGDAALALTAQPRALSLRASVGLAAEDAKGLAELLPGGGAELMATLPASAPLTLRLGLAPAQLGPQLGRFAFARARLERLRAALSKRGVDLDRDLFGALAPGAVLAINISPQVDLGRFVDHGPAALLQANPFELIEVAAVAPVNDEARAQKALEAVAAALPELGALATQVPDGWQVRSGDGVGARFGLRAAAGHKLLYLVGGGYAPEELRTASGAGPAAAGSDRGAAAQLDLGLLASAVHALPDGAYGAGPQAYVARSLVTQVIEPLKGLKLAADLSPTADAALINLRLELPEPSAKTARSAP